MTKLRRDARAFAARVKMGTSRVWLLVEGKVHDRAFYDRLLESHETPRAHGYCLRLAQDIEVDGHAAGGKSHLLKIRDTLSAAELIHQENKTGPKSILFAIDRDYDDLKKRATDTAHCLVTMGMDVEADILRHGDIVRAAASAYSIPRGDVRSVVVNSAECFSRLANLWRAWIGYAACAEGCAVSTGVIYSHQSSVNVGGFGPEVPHEVFRLDEELLKRAEAAGESATLASVRSQVADYYSSSREWRLVKGKWLARFVWHLIDTQVPDPKESNVSSETLVKTCLETLDLGDAWADEYRSRITELLMGPESTAG